MAATDRKTRRHLALAGLVPVLLSPAAADDLSDDPQPAVIYVSGADADLRRQLRGRSYLLVGAGDRGYRLWLFDDDGPDLAIAVPATASDDEFEDSALWNQALVDRHAGRTDTRVDALYTLADIDAGSAVAFLRDALADPEAAVRVASIELLGESGETAILTESWWQVPSAEHIHIVDALGDIETADSTAFLTIVANSDNAAVAPPPGNTLRSAIDMKVGHINLARTINGTGEHFIALVEALDRQGVSQHVVVRNEALAKRLAIYDNVSVGPTTAAAVVAYCLMPRVDVVHCHDERGAQAGLLLVLTRSVPFVMTRRRVSDPTRSPVQRSVYQRAAGVICTTDAGASALATFAPEFRVDVIHDIARATARDFEAAANRTAAEHLRIYRRATDVSQIPALLL